MRRVPFGAHLVLGVCSFTLSCGGSRRGLGVGVDAGKVDSVPDAALALPDSLSTSHVDVGLVDRDDTDGWTTDSAHDEVRTVPIDASVPDAFSSAGGCGKNPKAPSLAFRGVLALDFDEDGIADEVDNCPAKANSDQADSDGDGLGDACDSCPGGIDSDHDGVCDAADNCPFTWNPAQVNTDGNGIGNLCDSQRCYTLSSPDELQRNLRALLQKPAFTTLLADAHWRVVSQQTYCSSASDGGLTDRALSLQILDYTHRKQLTLAYLVDSDTLQSLTVVNINGYQGPQPSAEEGWDATFLAERDPQVRSVLDGLSSLRSDGPFFYEFGDRPGTNDPAFPACETGRCIDVLYNGVGGEGGYQYYSVVVDLGTCAVLGIRLRQ